MLMEVPTAAEVFLRAIALLKSTTYPYVATNLLEQERPSRNRFLWVMRDTPHRKGARKAEVITYDITPEEVADAVQRAAIGWHFLGVLHGPDDSEDRKAEFKSSGYRSLATEWLFSHDLADLPSFKSPIPIERVESRSDAEHWNRLAGSKVLRPKDWDKHDFDFRQYVMADDVDVYGKVRSVAVGRNSWVSDLWIRPVYRGKGFGKALMAQLLREDKAAGVQNSVLLASKDGARIYPALGYRQIAVMQMFCPRVR